MSKRKGNYPIIHGMSDTRTYWSWQNMRARCLKASNQDYGRYGGRGIRVCERWASFANFLLDMGTKPEGYSIERRDNDKDYCPENCLWIPKSEQAKNRSYVRYLTVDGVTKNLTEWCRHFGVVERATACQRMGRGWPYLQAVSTPPSNKWNSPRRAVT